MATPITVKTFRDIVTKSLDKIFTEVYGEVSFENEYMVEVNFDGQDEIQVRNNRNDDDI
jgi:hypothetical protein